MVLNNIYYMDKDKTEIQNILNKYELGYLIPWKNFKLRRIAEGIFKDGMFTKTIGGEHVEIMCSGGLGEYDKNNKLNTTKIYSWNRIVLRKVPFKITRRGNVSPVDRKPDGVKEILYSIDGVLSGSRMLNTSKGREATYDMFFTSRIKFCTALKYLLSVCNVEITTNSILIDEDKQRTFEVLDRHGRIHTIKIQHVDQIWSYDRVKEYNRNKKENNVKN